MCAASLCRSIVFAGGGTAGHVFPGLAVAERLTRSASAPPLLFVGSGRVAERRWVEEAGFRYQATPCRPGPRGGREILPALWQNLRGFRAARRLLKQEQCGLVVGLGGYASLPTACAAISRGIPLVLLEQNVAPGRATRLLARWARAVCVAFPETQQALLYPDRAQVTGNPLRAAFSSIARRSDERPRQLLILGGSSGARSLNATLPLALAGLREQLAGWQIVHQSGESDARSTQLRYARVGMAAQVRPFLDDLPQTLAASDLVVCRAGGTTLAELTAVGVPAVLVPYPYAAANHQQQNAAWAVATGGCACVDERPPCDCFATRLAAAVAPLLADAAARREMSESLRRAAHPDAAGRVAAALQKILRV